MFNHEIEEYNEQYNSSGTEQEEADFDDLGYETEELESEEA